MDKAQKNVTTELIAETQRVELTPEAIMRLVDLIFLGREDEGSELPS